MVTNKNITMRQYNGVDYDTLYPKTIASQIDDVYSKDEMSNLFLPKAGGSMGGILDMNGNRITNLPTPTSNSDPATKGYVDGKTNKYENGYYVGTGTTKVFNFNNKPIAIFMFNANSIYLSFGFIGLSSLLDMSSIQSVGDILWSDNKITISSDDISYYNKMGNPYYYLALFG